ncbi:MAG: AAA family ATPase [Deltaproteobacteria bacterium]|nr:AAA family ATPase [Deltaproteobacteria bacterium]
MRFVREFRVGQRKLSLNDRVIKTYRFGCHSSNSSDNAALANALVGLAGKAANQEHLSFHYFTMDLARDGSLPRFSDAQPPLMVIALAMELLTALDEIHARNVVHRDVKHANLLLASSWTAVREALAKHQGDGAIHFPRVMLADFGIAKHGAMRDENPIGRVLGTPAYLPPEALTMGNLDPRADLYAAGVIVYSLATGCHPVLAAGGSIEEVLRGHLFQLRPVRDFSPQFPAELDSAIMRLLEPDPTRRTATAALAYDSFSDWWYKEARPLLLPEQKELQGRPYLCTPLFIGREEPLRQARVFLEETLNYTVPAELAADEIPPSLLASAATHLPPSVMTLSGSPGIGKSRLLSEISRLAIRMRAVVLQGHCVSGHGQALESLRPALDSLKERAEKLWRGNELSSTVPALGSGGVHHRGRLSRLEHIPAEKDVAFAIVGREARNAEEAQRKASAQRRLWMAQAMARLLRLARHVPVVIIQEDSQWSDESSTATLEYLMQGVALARAVGHPARVAIILAHRPREDGNAVGRFEQVLRRQGELERSAVRIELSGLSSNEATELASSLLQTKPRGDLRELCEALFGNEREVRPLFLEQTFRFLLDDGFLTQDMFESRPDGSRRWSGQWNLMGNTAQLEARPASIHEAIGRNIEQLSYGTTRILPFAAAEGREFAVDIVARAAGYEPMEALDFLDEAASAGVLGDAEALTLVESVQRMDSRRFTFFHDRYHEAIYRGLPYEMRKECHAKLADTIVALRGETPQVAESLSRHFEQSGQHEKAYHQARVAAEQAQGQHAFDHAADLYRQAIALASRANIRLESSVHESYARAAVSAGLYQVATEQLTLRQQDMSLSTFERWDAALRLAELRYRQQDYGNAVAPLEQLLATMGQKVAKSPGRRKLASVRNMVSVFACGLWPRQVNMRPAADPETAKIRARAWHALAECCIFVDVNDAIFAASTGGRLAVTGGLHAFSAPVLAMWAYLFGSGGPHRLSRSYSQLAERLLEPHAGSAGSAARVPDDSAQALAHLTLLGGRMYRGELGGKGLEATLHDVRAGIAAAKRSGDPQRLWMMLILSAGVHAHTGHLESYRLIIEDMIANAQASRLFQAARLTQLALDGWLAHCRGADAVASMAFTSYADRAGEAGSRFENLVGQAFSHWCALLSGAEGPSIPSVAQRAQAVIGQWLKGKFAGPNDWPLSQCLATLALCARYQSSPNHDLRNLERLRRTCRKACVANRIETPLYLAAGAALDLLAGSPDKANHGFSSAIETAKRQGTILQLLDVYRLGARVYPESSNEARMYALLDQRLTGCIVEAPSPPIAELLAGEIGPALAIP